MLSGMRNLLLSMIVSVPLALSCSHKEDNKISMSEAAHNILSMMSEIPTKGVTIRADTLEGNIRIIYHSNLCSRHQKPEKSNKKPIIKNLRIKPINTLAKIADIDNSHYVTTKEATELQYSLQFATGLNWIMKNTDWKKEKMYKPMNLDPESFDYRLNQYKTYINRFKRYNGPKILPDIDINSPRLK